MQVSTICESYQQVLNYLDTARTIYKLIKQKYKEQVEFVIEDGELMYKVTIYLYEPS